MTVLCQDMGDVCCVRTWVTVRGLRGPRGRSGRYRRGWCAYFRSWRSHADAATGSEFNRAFYLRAPSGNAEDWLRTEVVAAYDDLEAEPSRAIPAEAVRSEFGVKWNKRSLQEGADDSGQT